MDADPEEQPFPARHKPQTTGGNFGAVAHVFTTRFSPFVARILVEWEDVSLGYLPTK